MLFTSWEFILCFLPIAVAVFLAMPARWRTARKVWLSLASLVFYAWWKLEYVPLLLASIGVNYALAEWIARRGGARQARPLVIVAVAVNLGALGFYKYTNFLLHSWGWLTHHDTPGLNIILPLAISFYTFTQIGYVVDVARDPRLHYNFLDYSLFVLFFPHLIAGPIVRHWEIIPQYAGRDIRVTRLDVGAGLTLFLLGLYKKTLLADPSPSMPMPSTGRPRLARRSHSSQRGRGLSRMRSRSTSTSRATRTWPSGWRESSRSSSPPTSTRRIKR